MKSTHPLGIPSLEAIERSATPPEPSDLPVAECSKATTGQGQKQASLGRPKLSFAEDAPTPDGSNVSEISGISDSSTVETREVGSEINLAAPESIAKTHGKWTDAVDARSSKYMEGAAAGNGHDEGSRSLSKVHEQPETSLHKKTLKASLSDKSFDRKTARLSSTRTRKSIYSEHAALVTELEAQLSSADVLVPQEEPSSKLKGALQRSRTAAWSIKAFSEEVDPRKHSKRRNSAGVFLGSRGSERPDPEEEASTTVRLQHIIESGPSLYNKSLGVINTKSPILVRWDLYCVFLLLYTAAMTPFEVSFLETNLNALFAVNRFVDLSFVVDMCINFYLPFVDKNGNRCMDQKLIKQQYLRGWFAIDLISILPFDIVRLLVDRSTKDDSDSNANVGGIAALLRLVRLFRIAKLLRILRTSRIFKRWESRFAVNYSSLDLLALMLGMTFMSHWMACLWGMLLKMDGAHGIRDFCRVDEGYCTSVLGVSDGRAGFDVMELSVDELVEVYTEDIRRLWEHQPVRIWFQLLFWTMGLLLGTAYPIGYHSNLQRGVLLVYMILAGIANAFFIGNVVSWIEATQEMNREFHTAMDHLNNFIKAKGLDDEEKQFMLSGELVDGPTLCSRCREYYIFAYEYRKKLRDYSSIQEQACASITSAMANTLYASNVKKVEFFRVASEDLVSELAENVTAEIYCVNDRIFTTTSLADSLYIISSGSVFVNFKILTEGESFGERVFFATRPNATRGHTATCLSNSVLYRIMKPVLVEALKKFGDVRTTKSGRQIPYLSIVRFNSNIMNFYNVIRRASILGIRYDYVTGAQVLTYEYGNNVIHDADSPVLELYSREVVKKVKCGVMPSLTGDLPGDLRDETTSSLTQSKSQRLMQLNSQGKSINVEKFLLMWQQEEAEYHMFNIKKSVSGKEQSLATFLRDPRFRGLQMETYFELLQAHCVTVSHLREVSAPEMAQLFGMPLGYAQKVADVLAEDARKAANNFTEASMGREQEQMVRTVLMKYALQEAELQLVAEWRLRLVNAKNQLFLYLQEPRFALMGLKKYVVEFEQHHLDLPLIRQLAPQDLVAIAGMPAGDALRFLNAAREDARQAEESGSGLEHNGRSTDWQALEAEVGALFLHYKVVEKDSNHLRMWWSDLALSSLQANKLPAGVGAIHREARTLPNDVVEDLENLKLEAQMSHASSIAELDDEPEALKDVSHDGNKKLTKNRRKSTALPLLKMMTLPT